MICQAQQHKPRNSSGFAGFSAFALKLIAIVGMTCNHAAYIFQSHLSFVTQCALFSVGGVTFPIMAYLLVEGYKHTSNLKRYAMRLAVFAAISQVPYWLFLDHNGNVIITLLLSLAALYLYDTMQNRALFWLSFVLISLASFWCDWGVLGPIMVLMFYVLKNQAGPQHVPIAWLDTRAQKESIIRTMLVPITADGLVHGIETLRNIAMLPFFLYAAIGNTTATIMLLCYNGKRGRPLKWFFYAYYPLHIAVLGVVATLI